MFTIAIWASINKGQICSDFGWKAYYRFNIARVWRSVLFSLAFTPYLCILSSGSSLLKWARALWQSRPAGPLLIKSGIKQEAGSAVELCLGEGRKKITTQLRKEIANFVSLPIDCDLGTKILVITDSTLKRCDRWLCLIFEKYNRENQVDFIVLWNLQILFFQRSNLIRVV